MEDTMEEIKYTVSEHCKQRYAERIMNKEDKIEAARFVFDHEDKIVNDINKLINYGKMIYRGVPSNRKAETSTLDVYLNGSWILLVDTNSKNVVTLYKIDFGLDDEFNQMYIDKMLCKLHEKERALGDVRNRVEKETETYRQIINDSEAQIKEYRSMIKNLEEMCDGYREVVKNNGVLISQAKQDVADVINTMIGKKEF